MEDHSLDEIRKTKRTIKNNVFIKLFEDVKNVYALYRELHPEDTTVKESDIEIHSMDSMFINEIYNDLGFIVHEGEQSKFVILVEAQSRWSNNMSLRLLLYLAETYRHYLHQQKLSVHSEKRIKIPKPDLYVVYTGGEEVPDDISFKDDYFGGDCPVDVKVKVLKQPGRETVSGQYIGFSKVYDEQRILHRNKIECIRETLRICKEKGYLVKFLTEHEEEVVTMLTFLFDEQQERETYTAARDKEKIAEGRAKGRAEGIEIGEKKGIEIGEKKGIEIGEKKGIEIGEKKGIEIGEKKGIEIGEKKGIEIGKLKVLIDLVKDGLLSITDAAKRSNMTESEFAELPDMKNS